MSWNFQKLYYIENFECIKLYWGIIESFTATWPMIPRHLLMFTQIAQLNYLKSTHVVHLKLIRSLVLEIRWNNWTLNFVLGDSRIQSTLQKEKHCLSRNYETLLISSLILIKPTDFSIYMSLDMSVCLYVIRSVCVL